MAGSAMAAAYPILLTLLAQSAVELLDEVVHLFDRAVSAREGPAERRMLDALAERGKGNCSRIFPTPVGKIDLR